MRTALRVYYDGKGFLGSQRQPEGRTVEGELLRAFEGMGVPVEDFQASGRTDRGVSALGNVFALTTPAPILPRALNARLPPDLRVLGAREVPPDFHPRYDALSRRYRYFLLDTDYDLEAMRRLLGRLVGERSFHNFAILEGRNPRRRLLEARVERKGELLVFDFLGESFLRQMVRRMVTAAVWAGREEIPAQEVERYLDPAYREKIPPMPPENLVLWEVRYPFEIPPEAYSLRRLGEALGEERQRLLVHAAQIQEGLLELGERVRTRREPPASLRPPGAPGSSLR
jgi:tRNA pseudouridine38-40 synthase